MPTEEEEERRQAARDALSAQRSQMRVFDRPKWGTAVIPPGADPGAIMRRDPRDEEGVTQEQADAANPPYEEPIPTDTTAGLSEEDQTLRELLLRRQEERLAQEAADRAAWGRGDVWDEERQRWRASPYGSGQRGRDRATQARAPFPWESDYEADPTDPRPREDPTGTQRRLPTPDVPPPGVGPSRIRREAKD